MSGLETPAILSAPNSRMPAFSARARSDRAISAVTRPGSAGAPNQIGGWKDRRSPDDSDDANRLVSVIQPLHGDTARVQNRLERIAGSDERGIDLQYDEDTRRHDLTVTAPVVPVRSLDRERTREEDALDLHPRRRNGCRAVRDILAGGANRHDQQRCCENSRENSHGVLLQELVGDNWSADFAFLPHE